MPIPILMTLWKEISINGHHGTISTFLFSAVKNEHDCMEVKVILYKS